MAESLSKKEFSTLISAASYFSLIEISLTSFRELAALSHGRAKHERKAKRKSTFIFNCERIKKKRGKYRAFISEKF
jgi:hypothetical protein